MTLVQVRIIPEVVSATNEWNVTSPGPSLLSEGTQSQSGAENAPPSFPLLLAEIKREITPSNLYLSPPAQMKSAYRAEHDILEGIGKYKCPQATFLPPFSFRLFVFYL